MSFLAVGPPVTHPTIRFCSGPNIACTFNWDSVVSSVIAIVITIVAGLWIASRLREGTPGKFQMVFELLIDYARDLIRSTVAEDAPLWILPLAVTIFFYILVANWLALLPIPGPLHPANSDVNQTAAMGVIVFVVVQWYSFRVLGVKGYFRRFTKPFDLPWPARILPFLPLNIIEEIAKPLTLALRLFGNIFGGLVMVYVLTFLLPQIPIPILGPVAGAVLTAAWKMFDVFVIGSLQAFIFMLLTIVYFEMAREGLEEGHGSPVSASAHRKERGDLKPPPAVPAHQGGTP